VSTGREVRIFDDSASLTLAARAELATQARTALDARGRFALVLCGGRTPQALYESLVDAQLDWKGIHVFFSDERCVPPEHPDSNFGMVRRLLLSRIPIPSSNVHRMRGEDPDPAEAAAGYELEIRGHFALRSGEWPRFDCVLLGMGADGHVASLFPGSSALEERERVCVAVPQLAGWRITLTLPALNGSSAVLVLAAGEAKMDAVRRVQGSRARELPAARLDPERGNVLWFLDRPAAAALAR
jgi:6-phosphogluconolactonase